jgi:hypothetical protein
VARDEEAEMTDAELDYYATPGAMTRLDDDPFLFDGLPRDAEGLCGVANGLIIHEYLTSFYGVIAPPEREEEIEARSVRDIVGLVDALVHEPLVRRRAPAQRALGNCRQFTVLTCALLRRAGVPARARCGFGGYFGDGWVDHWVVEFWDAPARRWRRADAQLDDVQRAQFHCEFDPLDLPVGAFLTGSEAWQRCRAGDDDPQRFGIMDMRGLWFVGADVVRDLAALRKVELLPWDGWGLMSQDLGAVEDDRTALLDKVAAGVVDGALDDWRLLYDDDRLRVPEKVVTYRYGRDVVVPT